jgi:ATP-dependent helicase STH1/SNF2
VAKLRSETSAKPEFADFDDATSTPNNGLSTAGVSSAGTPLASGATSGQRIKLNFAAGGQGKDVYTNGGDSGAGSDDD